MPIESARHLPDARAAVQGLAHVAVVVLERQADAGAALRGGPAQVAVEGRGVDEHAGVERAVRVEQGLDVLEDLDRLGAVHQGQELGARAAVAVLAAERAAVLGDQCRRVVHERAQGRAVLLQRDVEAHVDAAIAEVAERLARDAVRGHEDVEVAQVRAEVRGRNGRVLPAGPALLVVGAAARDSRAVGADGPQRGGLLRVAHDPRRPSCPRRPRARPSSPRPPPRWRRRPRRRASPRPSGRSGIASVALGVAHPRDEARVEALDRLRLVGEHRDDGVGRGGHVVVREHPHERERGDGDQSHRRLEHGRERALGADEEAREVGAVLGKQVLEGVAGDLAAEAAELGADERQVRLDELVETGTAARPPSPPPVKRRPSPSIASIETTLSLVLPNATAWGPHALLPIMPPKVARVEVDGSGPKRRPWGASSAWSTESTTPGWTRAVLASASISRIWFMWRLVSSTMPGPIALPATEVPPPRIVIGVPVSRATRWAAITSSASRGKTTTWGTTR